MNLPSEIYRIPEYLYMYYIFIFNAFQGRLLSLCSDNTVYLWEINEKSDKSVLEQKKEYTFSVEER